MSRTQHARKPKSRLPTDGKARDDAGNIVDECQRKPTGNMIPCEGDNGREYHWAMDYCTICAPNWGIVPEYGPVDVEQAKRDGLAVAYGNIPDEMFASVQSDVKAGRAEEIHVTRRYKGGNSVSYIVVRWKRWT